MKMFYRLALLLLAALFLFGCAGNKVVETGDTSVADAAESSRLRSTDAKLTRHEDILYACISRGEWDMLYAVDLKKGEGLPLCGRPDCRHDDRGCSACIGKGTCLTYSSGRLWWLDAQVPSYRLCSIALDGTDRRLEKTLKPEYEMMLGNNSFMGFYGGRLYRCGSGTGVRDAEIFKGALLYSQELNDDSEPKEILRLDDADKTVARMHENMLYVVVCSPDYEKLYSYNMDSETLTELGSIPFEAAGALDMFVRDDMLVFHNGAAQILAYSLKDGNLTNQYPSLENEVLWVVSDNYGIDVGLADFVCYDVHGKELTRGDLLDDAETAEDCSKRAFGSVDDVFFFLLETMYNTAQNHVYLVSIDPKTGEAKVLVEAEQHYANDLSTIIIE